MSTETIAAPTWEEDSMRWWGRVLTGEHRHWCPDWDFLPIDETTTAEWECCTCRKDAEARG